MISIRYPGDVRPVDTKGIDDSFDRAFAYGRDIRDERQGNKAFEGYLSSLYGGQSGGGMAQGRPQQPMSLSALGGVQREPLAPPMDPASQRVAQAHGDGDSSQIFGRFIKTVRDGGVTNPNALAAIAATGKHESGYDPKNAVSTWSDPSQSGQPGTSGGILSWRGPRLKAMQQFAQQNGDNPNAPSPETQAKFLLSENPQLIQQLQQAKSPQEAQQLMNNAWRFAGYDQQGGEAGARIQTAMGYAGQFGGQDAGPVGAISNQFAGQPAQAPAALQGSPSGGDLLPPRDVMLQLFKSKETRPLAIALAQSAQKMQRGDPMAQIEYEKALLELDQMRNPQRKPPNIVELFDEKTGQPYKAVFNEQTGGFDRVGGVKAPSDSLVTINNGEPGDGELRKSLDKSEGDQWAKYKAAGDVSASSQQDFQILDELIKIAPQGPLTGRLAEAFPGVSSAGDAFQSIVKRIAPTLRAPGSGSTSDIEYDGMLRSLPALSNKPEANVMINQIMKEKAHINVERAQIISDYQTNAISAAEARRAMAELNKRSIITPEMKRALGLVNSGTGKSNRTATGVEWSLDD